MIPRILYKRERPRELSGILQEEKIVIVSCLDEVEGEEIARVLGGRVRLVGRDKGGHEGNEAIPLVVPDTALHEAKEVSQGCLVIQLFVLVSQRA